MKKEKLRTTTIILGSILAVAIMFSQYLTPELGATVEKTKTEQSADTGSEEQRAFISLPTFSLPIPVSVQANLGAHYLFEILLEEDVDQEFVQKDVSFTSRFFHTMFRTIISPNAP